MPLKPFIMLDAMADLTSLDDRDALLISLGISLQEIFDLERVDFYHCRPGTEHSQAGWQIKKTLSLSNGEIQQAWQWRAQNTLNSDSDDFDPLLKSALSDLNTAESIHFRLVRTLKMNDQPHVLIDCQGKHLFKQTDLRALQGMTRIYENHLSLLKYSETDTLTGLLNRKTLERQFQKIMGLQEKTPAISIGDTPAEEDSNRRSQQEDDSYFLAVMDIDHFKRINDQFGHIYGDEVLLLIAQLMQASFRSGDYLFRFGGEEFVILMGPQGESNAFFAVERFREKVEQTTFPQVGQVTISIGFTRLLHSEVLSTVLGRADEALYQSKSNGRNKVTIAPVDALNLHHPVNGSIELF